MVVTKYGPAQTDACVAADLSWWYQHLSRRQLIARHAQWRKAAATVSTADAAA